MKRIAFLFFLFVNLGLLSYAQSDYSRESCTPLGDTCHPQYPYQDAKLSPSERAEDLLARLSIEQKISLMDYSSPAIPEFGIHQYNWWNEALHGCARSGLATVFPQAIGMAASWDDALLEKVFDVASTEQRIKYNIARAADTVGNYTGLSVWTPNINIFRDPRWGRGQETYGEDPYLTATMGKAVVLGLQGPTDTKYNRLHACLKHYAVHSGPEYSRHRFDVSDLPFRDLVETYLYAFKKIIQETDVKEVMCAYNAYEGKPCCSNDKLLTKILRNEWGYKNMVVTDCWAVHDNFSSYGHNQYPDDPVGAVSAAVRSGADLECGKSFFNLNEAVRQGKISEEEINSSVFRILRSRFELGEMDDPSIVEWSRIPEATLACDKHHDLALKMARETMVLLQNDGILPLKKTAKVAVVGPNADEHNVMLGNYEGTPAYIVSVLDGIRTKAGSENVKYFKLCEHATGEINTEEMNALLSSASSFDAIIFVGGISPQLEGEEFKLKIDGFMGGDRTSIELPRQQREAIQKIAEGCKTPLVYVNLSGSAIALKPESEKCRAMLQAWYGGESGGTAVADVLYGDYNPSGKLPVSFYASDADLMDYENYTMSDRTYRYFSGKALFPFGHGLSYTRFKYSSAKYKKGAIEFTLTNAGEREGDEIVQVYVRRQADQNGPKYSLRAFKRVHLSAGESRKLSIPVNMDLFNPETEKMETAPGAYTLYYGGTSEKDQLKSIEVTL